MPISRPAVPVLATAALLLFPAAASAGDPTLSPTAPPGLQQGSTPPRSQHRQKPARQHPPARPAKHRGGMLPLTGSDLALEAAAAAALIAGGTLLRAPRNFGRS